MTTQPQTQQPPNRERLQLMLDNQLLDVVERQIKQWSLPYRIEISDGKKEYGGKVYPEGQGVICDTLSQGELHLQEFITVEASTIRMKQEALKMSKTPWEVLIVGETGTGKETIAKSMIGDRKGLIRSINCAGIPSELMESILFGYKAGSFTGSSSKDKQGLISEAENGVCFLDEIGEMPMTLQGKLLRAIQEKRILKVGATTEEEINCKFVCATNRDLKKMVSDGTFRKDLYARISTLELQVKPLKGERQVDVIPILRGLIQRLKIKSGLSFLEEHGKDLADGTIDVPLNVRSLVQYLVRYDVVGRIK